jgi:hypothetical protein
MKASRTKTTAEPIAFHRTFGRFLPYIVLVSYTFLLYLAALSNLFVYDDQFQIVRNPNIQSFETASRYFGDAVEFDQAFGANSGVFY